MHRYDPKTAQRSAKSVEDGGGQIRDIYPSKFSDKGTYPTNLSD